MKLTLIILSSCALVALAVPNKRASSRCETLFPLIQGFLQGDTRKTCAIGMVAEAFFDVELEQEAQFKTKFCDIIDNADSMPELRAALDRSGVIDGVLQLGVSYLAFTSGFSMSYLRNYAAQGDVSQQCQGPRPGPGGPGGPGYGPPMPFTPAEVQRAVEASDKLAMEYIGFEKTRVLMAAFASFGPHFMMGGGLPEPCTCMIVTDNEKRCSLLTDALTPMWRKVMANPLFRPYIEFGIRYAQDFLGVNIVENIETDIPNLFCGLAEIQSIDDLRSFLTQHQILDPLTELAYFGVGSILTSMKRSADYTIQSYEEAEDDDSPYYYNWRPSEEDYQNAKAVVALVEAVREAGIDCLEPEYVPKTFQTWCPWVEAPDHPHYFNLF